MTKKFLSMTKNVIHPSAIILQVPMQNSWLPFEKGVFKDIIDFAFLDGKVGISILIHNYLGIPLLSKTIPYNGSFALGYKELL